MTGWYDLLDRQRHRFDGTREAPAHQQTTQARGVVVHVADDDPTRTSTSQRHEFTQAIRASISVDVHRRALPAGTDCRHRGHQRTTRAVARGKDDQFHTCPTARRDKVWLGVTRLQVVPVRRPEAVGSPSIVDKSEDRRCRCACRQCGGHRDSVVGNPGSQVSRSPNTRGKVAAISATRHANHRASRQRHISRSSRVGHHRVARLRNVRTSQRQQGDVTSSQA